MRRLCFALVALLVLAAPVAAQVPESYPARPVRVVVPFPAGGSVDLVTRIVAQELTRRLGQAVVVDNRVGGAGTVGTEFVVRAPADGHTLLMAGASVVNAPILNPALPYRPQRDLAPVMLVALQPNMVIVHPALPVRSVAELTAHARANPGRISYGTAGIASPQHMATEAYRLRAGVQMLHVPYRGGAPALNDLIAGQVQLMFETIPTALAAVQAGQVRALAVTSAVRSPAIPELPTVAEAGLEGYESRAWIGLLAPSGTPPAVVAALARHMAAVLAQRAVEERLLDMGLLVPASPPDAFAAFLRREEATNRDLIAAAGITLD